MVGCRRRTAPACLMACPQQASRRPRLRRFLEFLVAIPAEYVQTRFAPYVDVARAGVFCAVALIAWLRCCLRHFYAVVCRDSSASFGQIHAQPKAGVTVLERAEPVIPGDFEFFGQ